MNKGIFIFIAVILLTLCLTSGLAESEHSFGSWCTLRAPTCTQEGHQKRYCNRCDHWEQREVKKLPHTVESWEVTKEPTCTEEGVRVATCTVCNGFLRVKIDKLGHDWTVQSATVEPTCNSPGKGDLVCSRCGRVKKDRDIPRLEHQWSDWTVLSEPSGKKKGVRERTCMLCGKSESKKFFYEGTLYEGMDSDFSVVQLQVMLRDLGYYTGKISSGKFGGMTGTAVARFQKANGLSATEVADPNTMAAVRLKWETKTGRSMDSITMDDAANK